MADKNKIMTTRELAQYIKLNEKTVIKMAQTGKLPGVKISNKWRFHLSAIDDYLQNTVVKMPDDDLDMIIKTAEHIIPMSRLTGAALINLDLKATTKAQVLDELTQIAFEANILSEAKEFRQLLGEREAMLSTALGKGVAIPHPRDPQEGMFKRPHIIIGRSKKGVEFHAPDDEKVHVFFVSCATNEYGHLRLLAKVSKLLHVPGMHERLLAVKSNEELIKIFIELEQAHLFPLDREK
ncbi:PTS sugar transporter subunit IIA [Desulfosarcina sp.]|nr:PTS sugar transporter subunit IIA [Desulfosarcina sp.]